MALEVEWYDLLCFGIVGAAILGALWVLWKKEGSSKSDFNAMDENLLVARPENNGVVVIVFSGGRDHLRSSQLWTSCWVGVQPLWLLATRFISFVIMASLLSLDILDYDASIFVYYTEAFALVLLARIHFDIIALDGAFSFYFYTQWTFTLVMIYFALGTIVSAYGCWQFMKKTALGNGERDEFLKRDLEESMSIPYKEEFKQRARFWGYLMQITYQTCAGAVILTDIVFWCVIVPFLSNSHFKLNMLMSLMHTLNAAFLLVDTALNNLPFPWFRLAYFVLWSCVYVIFQCILHACAFTWWPYPFLELNTPWAPLWYFCMALIHIPCYGMYSLIVKAKSTVLPRLFPHSFLRS